MSTHARDDRLPTTGPDEESYDRYRLVTTNDGNVLVYDTECEDCWIEAEDTVDLEAWR